MEYRKAREMAAADAQGAQEDQPDLGDGGQENQTGPGDGAQNRQPLRGQGAHLARQPLAPAVANGHRTVDHTRGSRTSRHSATSAWSSS
jgi:hypothetical protein